MWYWYKIVPICMFMTAIIMLSFGIWGIAYWDQFSKLSSNIKEAIDKTIYNWINERR